MPDGPATFTSTTRTAAAPDSATRTSCRFFRRSTTPATTVGVAGGVRLRARSGNDRAEQSRLPARPASRGRSLTHERHERVPPFLPSRSSPPPRSRRLRCPPGEPCASSPDATKQQYVVNIGGQHFTTYCYGDAFLDKPVFYPVMSPNGARVNREYPMVEKVPGESADHPHHQSLFFTYDEVNGTNFWNPERTGRRIQQREVRVDGTTLVAGTGLEGQGRQGRARRDQARDLRRRRGCVLDGSPQHAPCAECRRCRWATRRKVRSVCA